MQCKEAILIEMTTQLTDVTGSAFIQWFPPEKKGDASLILPVLLMPISAGSILCKKPSKNGTKISPTRYC